MPKYKIPIIDDKEIEFRTMSAEEADRFFFALKQDQNPSLEEYIFLTITDDKYKLDDLPAGVIPIVIYASFMLSGITKKKIDFPNEIDRVRDTLNRSVYYAIYAKIAKNQNILLEDLKKKTFNELMELMVFSEILSGQQLYDTEKMKESILSEELSKAPIAKKSGVKGLTKDILESLNLALQNQENDPEAYI